MTHFLRINFDGDTNLGMYGFATDKYCLVGKESKKIHDKLRDILKVDVHTTSTLNTDLVSIFVSGNSNSIVIPDILEDEEKEHIRKIFGNVLVLKSKYTAFGNLILANDNGVVVSPFLRNEYPQIKEFFGLPCEITTIAGINIIGKLGAVTNRGCVVHPKTKDSEKKILGNILGVEVNIGTVNFGSSYPGSGLIANSHGFIVSEATSGYEAGNIDEALGFL